MEFRILVLGERRGKDLKRTSLETLGVARRLADSRQGRVDILVFGPGAESVAAEAGRYGADRVLGAEDDGVESYVPETYAKTLASAARSGGSSVVLASATTQGKDVAARATAALRSACLSDVVEIDWTPEGFLRAKRPLYSGKAFAWVEARPETSPILATLRPNAFPTSEGRARPAAEFVQSQVVGPDSGARARVTRVEVPAAQELDVAEASIVVSGGRGLKVPENFALVRDLASALGGAVGASRAVVDAGWIPHAHQVGQTGKVIAPSLYVACGISGAIQHLAGMSSSKVIVAINKDADAPIFKVADYGVVGDVLEVLPKLTEEVKKLKSAN